MRSVIRLFVVLVAAVAGAVACWSEHVTGQIASADAAAICRNPSSAPANVVVISNFAYSPQTIRITAGGHVTWVNCETTTGLGHTSTSDAGVWQSPLIEPLESFDRSFAQAGTFTYHCTPHPFMQGTVIVQ